MPKHEKLKITKFVEPALSSYTNTKTYMEDLSGCFLFCFVFLLYQEGETLKLSLTL